MIEIQLNNKNKIPQLGLGTYRNTNYKQIIASLNSAISEGISLIDTAEIYGNEAAIGKAIKELGIDRKKLFITTKVWNNYQGYDSTLRSFERSLKKLQTDYIDMYLIHWPVADKFVETWKVFEQLYDQGIVKNIGVSNFHKHHLEILLKNANIKPCVNQIELHPYFQQRELVEYCESLNIKVEAWSPIAKGNVNDDRILIKIGKKYGKSPVQITLRWEIQRGLITIPKSSNPEHIKEFSEIFDFSLEDEDMRKIENLDKNYRVGPDPDNFNF